MATLAELIDLAARSFQSGDLARAERLYRQILEIDAAQAHIHANLGAVLHATGRWQEAIPFLKQAVERNPHLAEAHYLLGNSLMNLGELVGAAECFRQTLRINPVHADAHNNLGVLFVGQKKWVEAADRFRHVVRINPRHGDAHNNLGIVLFEQKNLAEAAECFRQALRIKGPDADAYFNLGNVLAKQNQLAEAADCYGRALRLNPKNADAHNGLGIVLFGQKQVAPAMACYRAALRLSPAHADAYHNLGNALADQGELDEATTCYRHAIYINPNHEGAYNNLGNALREQGQIADAAECFQRALQIESEDHRVTVWNRALLRLLQGDFAGAWPDYELRWVQPGKHPRSFAQPRWDGSSFVGKNLLVHAEQGLGDTIQFVRFLPMVKERGGTVLLECPPALFEVLTGVAGADEIVTTGMSCPPFDAQIPLLSLPLLLGTTLATIPAKVPYLTVAPGLIERWGHEPWRAARREPAVLADLPATVRNVGIVWQGSMDRRNDCRSLPLRHFTALASINGVRLLSLQVGPGAEQLAQAPFPVIDLGSRFDPCSLADVAAVLKNLDLVVTVDTSVAHLAGALGVPVWVALPFAPDWRWLLDRSDSPWYPTMRLFRQTKRRDWDEVFTRMAEELRSEE